MTTLELIKLYREGQEWAKDKVVLDNVGLIWNIVRRFNGRGYDIEDLFQIGSIGLIKAIDKFDYSFEVQFSTYAVPMITGEIKRFLRDDGLIKISRTHKENAYKIKKIKEKYNTSYGKEPTINDIECELGITKEEIIMAMETSKDVESIYKTVYQGDGNPIYLIDKLTEEESSNHNIIDKIALKEVIDKLEFKERQIIIERYFNNKTQTDIAKNLGISQVQVSRIEKKVLLKMRQEMEG